jgi:cation/acetate symporter
MVSGIFWAKTTRNAAVSGMLTGLGLTIYYMTINAAHVRLALGLHGSGLWFDIQPVSAGLFGVLAGAVVTVFVSLLSRSARQGSS